MSTCGPFLTCSLQTSPNRDARVDDDDGHMIVIPGNDLTERCKSIDCGRLVVGG